MTQEEIELQFAEWLESEGQGHLHVPANADWINYAAPGDKKASSSAKLTYGDTIEGVYKSFKTPDVPPVVWRPTNGHATFTDAERQHLRAEAAARDAEKRDAQKSAKEEALQFYAELPEASPTHSYLLKKRITNIGALKADGNDLIVPVFNAQTDEFQTYQRINPNGDKRFPKNAIKKFGYAMPGEIFVRTKLANGNGPLIVCEGYANADVIRAVMLHFAKLGTVIAALDNGNLRPVVEALRKRFPLRPIIIAADNDADKEGNPGLSAAKKAASGLLDIKIAVPPPGDFWDLWNAEGGTAAVQRCLDDATEPEAPEPEAPEPEATDQGLTPEQLAEVKRLAALQLVEYDQQRKAAAKDLGIRVNTLDDLVAGFRPPSEEVVGQGTPLTFPPVEPWHEPVAGETLVTDMETAIRKHVILNEHQALAVALWSMHAHAFEFADHSPRLQVSSPAKRCGKTTTMDIIAALVPKPLPTENVSVAALFRVIEKFQPTLLIDEADAFLKDNEDMRGMLNAGHRCGGQVLRTVGEDFEPRAFSVWAPVAIAGINRLPPTLEDRSITILLRRKTRGEEIERLRRKREHLTVLARRIARWVQDNHYALIDADPALPEKLGDREQDNWRPLIAIADAISADLGNRARTAATTIAEEDKDDETAIMALEDVAAIFAAAQPNVESIPSQIILDRLVAMEDKPWATWRHGKPMTHHSLSRLLKPFGVKPLQVRVSGNPKKVRSYMAEPVRAAAERYVERAPEENDTADPVF